MKKTLRYVWFPPSKYVRTSPSPRNLSSPPPKSLLSLRLNLCTSEHANEQYVAAVAVGSLCSGFYEQGVSG